MVRLQQYSEKGFTLVELAIVMTIIGLLIGGILKGQMLMQNARVTAEVAEVKAISAADTTFKDMFNAVPGDMLNAGTRLVGCPTAAACNPVVASPGAGDGIVGSPTYFSNGTAIPTSYALTTTTLTPSAVSDETYLFWSHLLLANLIGNVTTAGIGVATPFAFGITHPDIKLGGGFFVNYDAGYAQPGNTAGTAGSLTGINGTVLAQITGAELTTTLSIAAAGNVLTPQMAQTVDTKMDDGSPSTGYVQAYGKQLSCFDTTTGTDTTASPGYLTSITTTDCGLLFRIEN